MTFTADHPRAAPIEFWREAEFLIRNLFGLFGDPSALALQVALTAKTHKLLSKWLRRCEAFVRFLLLIEACALRIGPTASSRPAGKMPAVRKKRFITHEPEHPEAWRVSFRVLAANSSPASGRTGVRGANALPAVGFAGGKLLYSTWPLAERCEALLRAFNDPHAYALRLARNLRAKPDRADVILDSGGDMKLFRSVIDEDRATDLWVEAVLAFKRFCADSS